MEVLTCTSADPVPGEKLDKVKAKPPKNPKRSEAAKAMWEARKNGGNWSGSGGKADSKDTSKGEIGTYAKVAAAVGVLAAILYFSGFLKGAPAVPLPDASALPLPQAEPVKVPEPINKRPHPT